MNASAPDPNGAPLAGPHLIRDQRLRWETTFATNPTMYGLAPSESGSFALDRFSEENFTHVLELGAGQGRDTLALLRHGFEVSALDYAAEALEEIVTAAGSQLTQRLRTTTHDVREPLPFPEQTFDACYSHMLFTMALSTGELVDLVSEIHRVVRPGGLCIYTVRHTGDAHFGAGISLGDNLYENGGFVVHFFDRSLVQELSTGFEIEDVTEFDEGALPRRLWRVTLRRL